MLSTTATPSPLTAPGRGQRRLGRRQAELLSLLVEDGGKSNAHYAQRMGVHNSAITFSVDSLVNRGLASRRQSEMDRREVILTATAEGERLVRAMRAEG